MKRCIMTLLIALLAVTGVAAENDGSNLHELLKNQNIGGGVFVYIGFSHALPEEWNEFTNHFLVQALHRDKLSVQRLRRQIQAKGHYGKASANHFDGERLPYADNLINAVVVSTPQIQILNEIARVLAPEGIVLIEPVTAGKLEEIRKQANLLGLRELSKMSEWIAFQKKRSDEIDEWTHYLHGPDNNAVAKDKRIAPPRSLQWSCGPAFGRSHEELASTSTMVSSGGKVFYIQDVAPIESIRFLPKWRLMARDAFNGTLLWEKEMKRWADHLRFFRSGPTHLPRRLVAVDNHVYVTLGLTEPVSKLNAATGRVLKVYEGTENTEEIIVKDGVLYLMVGTSEIELHDPLKRSRYGAPAATKKRYVLAVKEDSGRILWRKEASGPDYALPSTLAVSGNSLFYQSLKGLVHLAAESGKEKWTTERKTPSLRYAWSAPTLVVSGDVVLLMDKMLKNTGPNFFKNRKRRVTEVPAATNEVKWAVHGMTLKTPAKLMMYPGSEVRAYAIKDGKELWSTKCNSAYNSPGDIFVSKGLVWIGPTFNHGYDLLTGEIKKKIGMTIAPKGDIYMFHDRCYRNKATEKYIIVSRSGVELIDYDKGWTGNNSWVRGICQYGLMPANGLVVTSGARLRR